jgi:hypothetical protein
MEAQHNHFSIDDPFSALTPSIPDSTPEAGLKWQGDGTPTP